MIVVLSIAFSISCGCWLAPRLFTYADRKATLAHLNVSPQAQPSRLSRLLSRKRPSGEHHPDHQTAQEATQSQIASMTSIDIVEEMTRRTRSGAHARDVVSFAIHSAFSPREQSMLADVVSHASIDEVLERCASLSTTRQHHDNHLMFQLVHSAYVNGVFVAAALDHVAGTLRTHQAIRAELKTATTQSLLTARVLSYLPLVAFSSLLLFSSQTRQRVFEFSMLFFLGTGIAMNRVGALWIRRIIHRTMNQPVDEIAVLAENLVASLRAGCSMTDALQRWRGRTSAGTRVAHAITSGAPLTEALRQLPSSTSAYRLTQAIESGYSDGLPLANTMHRLVDDARNSMRHHSEVLIRQLPTRLSFPLVLCILPSFLFITVVPLMMNALAQLAPAISPPPIAIS